MKFGKFEKILLECGRGALIGLGVGSALFGLVLLSFTWTHEQPLNIGALLAVFSGSCCIFLGLNLSKKPTKPS